MKFNFKGDMQTLTEGIKALQEKMGYTISKDGFSVNVCCRPGDICVWSDGKEAEIQYEKKIHFFRALGLLCEHFGEEIQLSEKPVFNKNGMMIDASRNGVMTVSSIKKMIDNMAVMGLNLIMMYTEDTYEVEKYPYFGYMRGRYTEEELRECDRYADMYGIEMIPCIQTLAHLNKALKWNHGIDIADTDDNLLVGSEDTYVFIRNLLQSASKPFKSNRIHIGMDEAWTLGLGKYVKRNGYKSSSCLIKEHFLRVKKICDELKIDVIMWADMFFRSCSEKNEYYDPSIKFTDEIKESVPADVGLVYWDYYTTDRRLYDAMIKKHLELSNNVIFAGGIWIWGRMNVNYTLTFKVTLAGLEACVQNNIREVFATMWGDNGSQTNPFEALLGMQLYAEIGYGHKYTWEHLEKRFAACTGECAQSFLELGNLDNVGQKDYSDANPSEYLLWQDALMGLLDSSIDKSDLSAWYKKCADNLKKRMEFSPNFKEIFEYAYLLAYVLEIKAELGIRLRKAYKNNNIQELKKISGSEIVTLLERVQLFENAFKKMWMSTYKVFGYEVIDMRIGALKSRLCFAKERVDGYINGAIGCIDELEQEILPYNLRDEALKDGLNARTTSHIKYISAGYCSHGFFD